MAQKPTEFHRRPMKLDRAAFDGGKALPGHRHSAGTGGRIAGAGHGRDLGPSQRRPFIGAQLIQRLVASNPSPAYVARVAAVFADDGLGARGNLKAVTRAVLLDPEARFPDLASPHWGKVREPILRFSGWARAFGARSSNGAWAMPDTSDNTIRLAQSPMRAQRVQLLPAALHARRHRAGAPGPGRAGIADHRRNQHRRLPELPRHLRRSGLEDLQTDYAAELALAGDPDALVAHVALLLAGDAFSEATARRIATALRDIPPERPRDRVRAAIVLVAASPEYLVQK